MNSTQKFTIICIFLSSMSFCNENDSLKFMNEKYPPSTFFELKNRIDKEIATDTLSINECYEKVIDTANINIDSAFSKQHIWKNRFEFIIRSYKINKKRSCEHYHIGINGYSDVKYFKFSESQGVKFIAQSSHDGDGAIDIMILKFSENRYAYVREHVCGMAMINYAKNKITIDEIVRGETQDDTWHFVKFDSGKCIVENFSENAVENFLKNEFKNK